MTVKTPAITLRQVLDLAHQLPRPQRAELIAQLARDLVDETPAPTLATNDAWEQLNAFRDELAALDPPPRTLADQLDRDRRERQASLEGSGRVHD